MPGDWLSGRRPPRYARGDGSYHRRCVPPRPTETVDNSINPATKGHGSTLKRRLGVIVMTGLSRRDCQSLDDDEPRHQTQPLPGVVIATRASTTVRPIGRCSALNLPLIARIMSIVPSLACPSYVLALAPEPRAQERRVWPSTDSRKCAGQGIVSGSVHGSVHGIGAICAMSHTFRNVINARVSLCM